MARVLIGAALVAGVSAAAFAQTKTAGGGPSGKAAASAPGHIHLIVAPTGNEARYRVREQLVGLDLPNDAIGATKDITGELVFDPNGNVIRDSSKISVVVAKLKSDKDRRDMYVKTRTLETSKFPTVELVPTMLHGLATKPSSPEPTTFDLMADLTVHGVTHPTAWKVTARADGDDIVGTATTAFTFKDFGLDQPHVPIVLDVKDTIKLEYDFRFNTK